MQDAISASLLDEIRGEGHDASLIPEGKKGLPFYKLNNKDPNKSYTEADPFVKGIKLPDDTVAEAIRAVILYTHDCRSMGRMTNGKWVTTCRSADGESPHPSIKEPQCRKLDAAGVSAVLSSFKGMEKARVESLTTQLTDGKGCLQFCGLKGNNGVIPICPRSKGDKDAGTAAPCKQQMFLAAYDVERGVRFNMTLAGQSIYNSDKFKAPIHELRDFLGKKRLPPYVFEVTLSPAPTPKGHFFLNITDRKVIEDKNVREMMRSLAEEAKESYLKSATIEPRRKDDEPTPAGLPPKTATPVPPRESAEPEKPADLDDDDIPF